MKSEPANIPTLDISAPEGTRVQFLNMGGAEWDRVHARKHLNTADTYTVKKINISGWSSNVELEGLPVITFNTVMFKEVS